MTGRRSFARLALLVPLAVSAAAAQAPAAETAEDRRVRVRLQNGDVLTGRLLRESPEDLVLETRLLGEVTIPRPAVAGMMSATTAAGVEAEAGAGAGEGMRLPPLPQRKPAVAPIDPAADLEVDQPEAAAAEAAVTGEALTGELAVGFRMFHGRDDRSEIYLDGEASLAWADNRIALDAEVERDHIGDRRIEDSFDTELRLDLGVDEPPTISPTARWMRDEAEGVALRQEYTVLVGAPLVDTDDGRYLRVEAGPVYYHEQPLSGLAGAEVSSGVGVTWGLSAVWPVTERLRFIHDQEGLLPLGLQGRGTPWVETSTGFRYSFRDGLFLRALYELNWDADTPADLDPLERVLRLTVGYAF